MDLLVPEIGYRVGGKIYDLVSLTLLCMNCPNKSFKSAMYLDIFNVIVCICPNKQTTKSSIFGQ